MTVPAWSCDAPETQTVRVLDVVLVGPAMIAGAALLPRKHMWLAVPLGVMGGLTIWYNYRNHRLTLKRAS